MYTKLFHYTSLKVEHYTIMLANDFLTTDPFRAETNKIINRHVKSLSLTQQDYFKV